MPYQLTAVFTTPAMIAGKPGVLRHFAAAYQQAFLRLDAAGHPIVDATTDAVIPLLTRYVFTGDPDARPKVLDAVGYYDAGRALDVKDVLDQVRWFRQQGLVKGDADRASMLDTRFLPAR